MAARVDSNAAGGASQGDRSNNGNENNGSKNYLSPEGPSMLEKSPSLQRLHNQSSTETSGLGETLTSGFSSQESFASFRSGKSGKDLGLGGRENSKENKEEKCGGGGSSLIISSAEIEPPMKSTYERRLTPDGATAGTDGVASHARKSVHGQLVATVGSKPTWVPAASCSSHQDSIETVPGKSCDAGPDFDALFIQSKTLPVQQMPSMGLQVDQIDHEWNQRSRNSSIKSRSSIGSFRSRTGSTRGSRKFLGKNTESRWTKWSKERRASFRRRLELLDKPEPDIPERSSTPVKKARQEGLKFIHPDLERKYISEEDIHYIQRHRQQRMQTYQVIEKNSKILFANHHDMHRLTVYEMNVLTRFWEHHMFIRSRYVSILLSIVTTILLIISICSSHWIIYPSTEIKNRYGHEGLWLMCSPVTTDESEENCTEMSGIRTCKSENRYPHDIWDGNIQGKGSNRQNG